MRTSRSKLLLGLLSLAATICFVIALPASATLDLLDYNSAVDAATAVDPSLAKDATNDPAKDFAVGGGQHDDLAGMCSNSDNTCNNEGFAAHSDADGANPQGHVSSTIPNVGELKGPVTCLHVVGNRAFILFTNMKDFPGSPPGTPVALDVVDNGNPASGAPPDMIRNYPDATTLLNPLTCFVSPLPPVPLVRGNIVVHDAP
jgi:hypothetical protein